MTGNNQTQYKNLYNGLLSWPKDQVTVQALMANFKSIKDPDHFDLIIGTMRQDPTYSESKFKEVERGGKSGILFKASDLSSNQLHVIFHLVALLASKNK